jgi:hypothetical protein
LDNAPSHIGPEVLAAIFEINCRVVRLPPGTTDQFQPLDVGINGPFKARCKCLWSEWMIRIGDRVITAKEDRVAMTERIVSALSDISADSIKNAFIKCGLQH